MKHTHFLLIFFLFSLSSMVFSEELITFKKYIVNYPKYDKTSAMKDAEKEYKKKGFRLVKIKEEVDITSKIGVRLKGKYYGQKDSGAIKIGRSSIQWFDIPEDKKYLFSEKILKIKYDNLVKKNVIRQKREYTAKRREDVNNYKDKLLASDKNLMMLDGTILYNIQIKKKNEWMVRLVSNGKEYTFLYKNLLQKESMKIKSGVKVITKIGKVYKNIKMISKNPVEISFLYTNIKMNSKKSEEIYFYDGHKIQQKEKLKLKDLSTSTQKYFKYSADEEKKYLQYLEKERLARIERLEIERLAMIERKKKKKERKDRIESQFSWWDGSHKGLTKYIKKRMRNSDSYEHASTTYIDKGNYLKVYTSYKSVLPGLDIVVTHIVVAEVNLKGKVIKIISGFKPK